MTARAAFVLAGALVGCRAQLLVGTIEGESTDTATSDEATLDADAASNPSTTEPGDASMGSGEATLATIDDDAGTSSGEPTVCELPPHVPCDGDSDPFHAIGLGCPDGVTITDALLHSNDFNAWKIAREYGNAYWTAREGTSLLALTTGTLPQPDASGRISVPVGQTDAPIGNNGNPDSAVLPTPMLAQAGSNGGRGGTPFEGCDGVGDCSDSLPGPWQSGAPAHDLVWLEMEMAVPPGVQGWRADVAWLTAEFPDRIDSAATDLWVWWQSSEAFTGNVATLGGGATSVTNAVGTIVDAGFSGAVPELAGTGHEAVDAMPCTIDGRMVDDCPRGGATPWLRIRGVVAPGETVRHTIAVFDLADTERDTALLLDGWRWECDECALGVDCGLAMAP